MAKRAAAPPDKATGVLPDDANALARQAIHALKKLRAKKLGVSEVEIARHGAVSAAVARAMAQGALTRSEADLALAITGFAGPAAQNDEVGLVHLACATRDGTVVHRECHFGDLSRERIRHLAVKRSLDMIGEAIDKSPSKQNGQAANSAPT